MTLAIAVLMLSLILAGSLLGAILGMLALKLIDGGVQLLRRPRRVRR